MIPYTWLHSGPAAKYYRSESMSQMDHPKMEKKYQDSTEMDQLDSVTKDAPPKTSIRYGDEIRLWAISQYLPASSPGGYVGWYDSGRAFRRSKNPDKQGDITCIPPLKDDAQLLFHESRFIVTSPVGVPKGSPLFYGDVCILVDQRNYVWNNKIGIGPTTFSGYMGPRQRYTNGEMYISFELNTHTYLEKSLKNGKIPVYYGDKNISITVVDSHRVRRKFNQKISHYVRDPTNLQGGYLCCDGRGKPLVFEIHGGSAPSIVKIEKIIPSSIGMPISQVIQNRIAWGSSILIDNLEKGGNIRIHLSDGGYLDIEESTIVSANGEIFWELCQSTKRPARVEFQCVQAISVLPINEKTGHEKWNTLIYSGICSFFFLFHLEWSTTFTIVVSFFSLVTIKICNSLQFPYCDVVGFVAYYTCSNHFKNSWKLTPLAWEGSSTERLEVEPKTLVEDETIPYHNVPRRFLVAEEGNMAKARQRWAETLQWREEQDVDKILEERHEKYSIIKKFSPHFIHKTDKLGHPIYIEKLGEVNLKELKLSGVELSDLFRHYIFNMEYIFHYICTGTCSCVSCLPSETRKLLIVLDVKGIGMRDLAGEVFEYIRGCTLAMQRHYPQRSYKIFIINVPSWFGITWKVLKTLLNETTKAKTNILAENQVSEVLLENIAAENLPLEYGGCCECVVCAILVAGGCSNSESEKLELSLVNRVLTGELLDTSVHISEQPIEILSLEQFVKTSEISKAEPTVINLPVVPSSRSNLVNYNEICAMEGFLCKKAIKQPLNPLWKKRYFFLSGQVLRYAKTPSSCVFNMITLVPGTISTMHLKSHSIEVITPLMALDGKSLYLQADNPELTEKWFLAIDSVIRVSTSVVTFE